MWLSRGKYILSCGNSQCKSPGVSVCQLCLKNIEEISIATAEATWKRVVNIMLLVMKRESVYYHRCTSEKAFSPCSTWNYTPHSWHLSLKSTEIGVWV